MHIIEEAMAERAVIVSVVTPEWRRNAAIDVEHSLAELANLAETAGVETVATVIQSKEAPDPRSYIGKGKVQEVKALAEELGATTAIFDHELSGAQVRNLEEMLDLKIVDRTQLILDIFAQRAKTREGIIQVELAQLSYLLPRLSGHGRNLSRLGGGIGTRGPGESKLETDRRHIRKRITDLKHQLDEVVRHRQLHRERRRKSGAVQVALAGYTNAGKSTLLNQLAQADAYVENQLFATLDPTSRVMELPNCREVILTDTVGFIQNLPTDLIAAFRATLEEVCEANLILHVVDSSSPIRGEQSEVVNQILAELGAAGKPTILVYNKIDLCPEGSQPPQANGGQPSLAISAYDVADLERLKELIQHLLAGDRLTYVLPAQRGDLLAVAYRLGDVVKQELSEDGEEIRVTVQASRNALELQGYKLEPYLEREAAQATR